MFSVVIPTYNHADTLTTALLSVLKQTRLDLIYEIVIVDDGSTDNTYEAVRDFKALYKEVPIRYFKQENKGASAARNYGIKNSAGEWIALLDADDEWVSNKIEKQYECICKNDGMCFLGSFYPIRFLFKKYDGLVKVNAHQLCIRSMPYTPSVVFKKNVGIELGLFPEDMRFNEDANFFQKFLLKDSYYLLSDNLVTIDNGKSYSSEKGLSSNVKAMYDGKKRNMKELKEMGLISGFYCTIMCLFCDVKYLRKIVINKIR